jgi:uncharacterized membrane protein YciS (DUF1049 family)
MWALRATLIVIVIICVVAFAIHNLNPSQKINIDLIFAKYLDVPLVMVVFWSFAAGMIVSLVLFILVYVRQAVQIRGLQKLIRSLDSEVTVLRNRPIEESADLLKGQDEKRVKSRSPLGGID